MVPQGAVKRWLTGHVAYQTPSLGIEPFGDCDLRAFSFFGCRLQLKILLHHFTTTVVDDSCRCSDFLVRKSGHVLLQEIHETAFPLHGAKEQQA